ncbi:DUF2513 domain-containing protein [Microbulbifer variabilis]|uniref:DUF2513 domain-containing protein n=1 Tax=Microbulbifer variabilis TaxID=266805 RepID=A0ABY4VCX0_9GAMM|nr:DUF2513 domain-containing protein [Microbulbifer variabilis]USD22151.1 DUF2513 domain-containing protein [Microbulbifer variabilis]
MRIDIEYLKELLGIILDHDKPDFNIGLDKINPLWNDDDKLNKLVFHLEILNDQGLIKSTNGSSSLGFRRASDGSVMVGVIPLRLTADGHQFASDLSKPGVLEKLKTSFQDSGPTETVKLVFALGKKAIDRKLAELSE